MLTQPRIAQGRTADVFAWETGQILKLFHTWVTPESIDTEMQTSQVIHAAGLPVPAVIDRVTLDGRQGVVYERVEGPTMLRQIQARPWLVGRFARQLADLHATLHNAQIDGLPSQRARLRHRIAYNAALPDDLRARALATLDTLPDDGVICHGDFHPDNVILTARGPVIIDWLDATQGHPLADVARTSLLLSLGEPLGMNPAMYWLINRLRVLLHDAYIRRYCALTGATQAGIDAWMVPVVAVRLDESIPNERERLLARLR